MSRKSVEKIQVSILCSVRFSENRDFSAIMQKNMVPPGSPQLTI